jgi:hypothetical protein
MYTLKNNVTARDQWTTTSRPSSPQQSSLQSHTSTSTHGSSGVIVATHTTAAGANTISGVGSTCHISGVCSSAQQLPRSLFRSAPTTVLVEVVRQPRPPALLNSESRPELALDRIIEVPRHLFINLERRSFTLHM